MCLPDYLDKTLGELAKQTHILFKPIRIFLLEGKEDTVGHRYADGYSVKQIITQFPALTYYVVATAENYYGEIILRVRLA